MIGGAAMLLIRDELPSTMELAHDLAAGGAPAGQAVLARRQRAGRGRQGRAWSAEPGGLWLSVICRPDGARGLDALSLRVGLAAALAVERLVPSLPRLHLKWPNDLLLDGRKVGGVLCEARWQGDRCAWVVVGLGLNVRNPLPEALRDEATRLADHVADPPEPESLAAPLAAAIVAAAAGGPLTPPELAAWWARDALRGQPVTRPRPGIADGVTADGALVVRGNDGARHECRDGVVVFTS